MNIRFIVNSLLVVVVIAFFSSAAAKDQKKSVELQDFEGIAEMLSDVSDRRRRVVYKESPSSFSSGVIDGFVHVGDGSSAFSRTDMVVDSLLPIIFRRNYLSNNSSSKDFGSSGWSISILEKISVMQDSGYRYEYGNGKKIDMDISFTPISKAQKYYSDFIEAKTNLDSSGITVTTRTGLVKKFKFLTDEYLLTQVLDSNGNSLNLTYTDGYLNSITTSDFRRIDVFRDSDKRVIKIRDSNSREVSYRYNSQGVLDSVRDLRDEVWNYQYSKKLLTKALTPEGFFDLEFEYDSLKRVNNSYVNGYSQNYIYSGLKTTVTTGVGSTTEYLQDESGLTTRVINSLGTTTEIKLDNYGLPARLLRNGKLQAQVSYSNGGLSSVSLPQLNEKIYYDGIGRVMRLDASDISSSFSANYYNGTTPSKVVYKDGSLVSLKFTKTGRLKSVFDSGSKWEFTYRRNIVKVNDSYGGVALLKFDKFGQLSKAYTKGRKNVSYSYDDAGLRTQTRASSGAKIGYRYDASGSLISTSDGYNGSVDRVFEYKTGVEQRLEAVFGSEGDKHFLTYDSKGSPVEFKSSSINNMNFEYDDLNRLVKVSANGYEPLSYQYRDGESNLVVQLDERTTYAFNQQREDTDFAQQFTQKFVRVKPSSHGILTYDNGVKELSVAAKRFNWTPADVYIRGIKSMRIEALMSGTDEGVWKFSMPSNKFFVPEEFVSVNCCFCCGDTRLCQIP